MYILFLPYDTLASLFKNLLRAISLFFTFPRFFLDSTVGGLSVGCQSHLKIIIISIQLTGPRTRKPPHGLCGGTPDPNYATRLPYWFSMSFFLTGFGARLAFQRGFLNIEKSTFALGSMEELDIICRLGDNFYAFRVSHYTWTHPSSKNAVLKETVSCATPYNQRKPPTPRTPQLALHMRVKGSVPRRPGRFIHAQLQNQKSRGPGYQISYPGFKHEKEKKG